MAFKKWNLCKIDKELARQMSEQYGIPAFLALLLQTRGITEKNDVNNFLHPENLTFNPMSIADMDKAVSRIEQAIDSGEKIVIYGDYDADGVTATTILYSYLETRTDNLSYYIPDRNNEGYGMHREILERLQSEDTELIITVDNGISAIDEVAYAASLGIDVVITDHHLAGDVLPDACAVVDPHRPDCPSEFKDFAGVGVALMLICALEGEDSFDFISDSYSDIAAIGTVADVVPLTGMNRAIICRGIEKIRDGENIGINAMLNVAGISPENVQSSSIAFGIAPRINATGRISDSKKSAELFLCDDEETASVLALEIDAENKKRQQTEAEVCNGVNIYLKNNPHIINDRVIVIEGENWHGGVIGIVAARMVERFGKPCIIITHNNEKAKGSGRSIEGFSLYDAIEACSDVITGFGGHDLAAGVSLCSDGIDEFRKRINQYAAECFPVMPTQQLEITCKVNPAAVSVELVNQVKMLEPFGAGNSVPVFGLFEMKLEFVTPLSGGKHLKLKISKNGYALNVFVFGVTPDEFAFKTGEILNFAVTLELNTYKGTQSVTAIVKDIHPADLDEDAVITGNSQFESFKRGEVKEKLLSELLPERQHLAAVYRFFRDNGGWNGQTEYLMYKIKNVPYPKILASIEVLADKDLFNIDYTDGKLKLSLCNADKKVDLESSHVLKKLKGGN